VCSLGPTTLASPKAVEECDILIFTIRLQSTRPTVAFRVIPKFLKAPLGPERNGSEGGTVQQSQHLTFSWVKWI
jgi:hypothetical protein